MKHNFQKSKVLVVNNITSSQKMLAGVFKVLGVGVVDTAYEATDAYNIFKRNNHDVIFAELLNGFNDGVDLAKKVRYGHDSPNKNTPIVVISGPKPVDLLRKARDAGVSDLLQVPYAVDDVANRLSFFLQHNAEELAAQAALQQSAAAQAAAESIEQGKQWPNEEESLSLTHLLLDHYVKHHELVLMKLKFAQSATRKSIDQIRNVHEKIKDVTTNNIKEFKDFDTMWEDVISMFLEGGLSEDSIFKVEDLITKMPKEIEDHYNDLNQSDKNFITLVESLNRNAYQKALEKVVQFQKQPNPFSGKTSEHFKVAAEQQGQETQKFFYEPFIRRMVEQK